jgi:hypothetical protein
LQAKLDAERAKYAPISNAAASLFFALSDLVALSHMYRFSRAAYLKIFLQAVSTSAPSTQLPMRLVAINSVRPASPSPPNACQLLPVGHVLHMSFIYSVEWVRTEAMCSLHLSPLFQNCVELLPPIEITSLSCAHFKHFRGSWWSSQLMQEFLKLLTAHILRSTFERHRLAVAMHLLRFLTPLPSFSSASTASLSTIATTQEWALLLTGGAAAATADVQQAAASSGAY